MGKSIRPYQLFTLVSTLTLFIVVCVVMIRCEPPKGKILQLTKSWEKAVPQQTIPKGLNAISAASCGTCHVQHYQEWKLSTHAHAWTDLQFQAELRKESCPFMCINCHTPLQNQQPYVIDGLVDGDIYRPVKKENPLFDRALQQEGINCASALFAMGWSLAQMGH